MSRDWILREQGSRDWRMLPIAIVSVGGESGSARIIRMEDV